MRQLIIFAKLFDTRSTHSDACGNVRPMKELLSVSVYISMPVPRK